MCVPQYIHVYMYICRIYAVYICHIIYIILYITRQAEDVRTVCVPPWRKPRVPVSPPSQDDLRSSLAPGAPARAPAAAASANGGGGSGALRALEAREEALTARLSELQVGAVPVLLLSCRCAVPSAPPSINANSHPDVECQDGSARSDLSCSLPVALQAELSGLQAASVARLGPALADR